MAEHLAASALRARGRRVISDAEALEGDASRGVLASRFLAYILDSVILAAFAIAFVAVGSLNLLLQTDGGFTDVSDSARWQFVYVCLAAIPAWFLLTLLLLWRRGQTIGQYVLGIAVTVQEGRGLNLARIVLYEVALHPLIFHPILGLFWLVAALVSISVVSSNVVFSLFGALTILCFVAPVAGLIVAAADEGRRGLHDRIAGTTMVRLE